MATLPSAWSSTSSTTLRRASWGLLDSVAQRGPSMRSLANVVAALQPAITDRVANRLADTAPPYRIRRPPE
eukprot:5642582-Pyramimonas_sp.AAC.2